MSKTERLVLLGCGYVSAWAFRHLAARHKRRMRRGELEVVLLSDSDHHAFHGFTGEFLSGLLSLAYRRNHYSQVMEGVRYIRGSVIGINQLQNRVRYRDLEEDTERDIEYAHVVLGVGSTDNDGAVAGLREHGLSIKRDGGIEQCRERILSALTRASESENPDERVRLLTFLVVGGGFAGVEICGNLCEYLEMLRESFPVLQQGYVVHLVYPGQEILPELGRRYHRMRRYAESSLERYGVRMSARRRLARLEADSAVLDDGTVIETEVAICAIGQRRIGLDSTVAFARAANGSLVADDRLRAVGFRNIWVGGDIATVRIPFTSKTCRTDALWAIKQGGRIGKNLSRVLSGRRPRKFIYPGLGQTASFGFHQGILELYGMQFTGPLAWYMRIGFFLRFYPVPKRIFEVLRGLFHARQVFPQS
jgi:NADH dehydrogenase